MGFPGPHHTVAERALGMKVAMTVLAIGAIGAGLVQIPGVDDVVVNFLRPTFAGSPLYEPHTRDGLLDLRAVPRHGAGAEWHRDRLAHLGQAAEHRRHDKGAAGAGV